MPRAVKRHFEEDAASLLGLDRMTVVGDRFHLEVAKLLVERKLLSLTRLATALRLRAAQRKSLADLIMAQGVRATTYYRAAAEIYGLRFVDLVLDPVDPELAVEGLAERGLKAWRREGDRLLIATSAITRDQIEWADARFGESGYDFVITVPARH